MEGPLQDKDSSRCLGYMSQQKGQKLVLTVLAFGGPFSGMLDC